MLGSWRPAAIAIVLLVAACGSPTGASQTRGNTSAARVSSPPPSGQAAGPPLASGLIVLMSTVTDTTTLLRIVDAKGHVYASTQFTPPARPAYGPCASLTQPPVRIAQGGAFFADSAGVVRTLAPNGAISQVATFPLTKPNQALSYAVSPDGSQLIAIVFSTPPLHNPPPRQLGDPLFDAGSWSVDLETAKPGGATVVALHRDLGSGPGPNPTPTEITGWDNLGPTATLNSAICTQQGLPSNLYNGTLIHLAIDGTHLDRIGGPSCNAWDELSDGTVLCGGGDWQSFDVRRRDGTLLWSGVASDTLADVALSPDGAAVASSYPAQTYFADGSSSVASGARAQVPQMQIVGWAGPSTVVILRDDGHVGLAPARDLNIFTDTSIIIARSCATCGFFDVKAIGTLPFA